MKRKGSVVFAPRQGMEAGKGDFPRPYSVDREKFDKEWDRIFGKKEPSREDASVVRSRD